ncbi:MAG TPA: hypothetical protein VGV14_02970 [Rhodanobacter sp.]|nr:hypothetical protein [Rhodanobacter sp.]
MTCVEHELPLYAFAWNADVPRACLKRDAFYLIRPDGYIALAAADGDPQQLREYLQMRYCASNPAASNNPAGNRSST